MGEDPKYVRCASCGHVLEDQDADAAEIRHPCPQCGSTARQIDVRISDEISGSDPVNARGGRQRNEPGGRKRPYVEAVFGKRELTFSTGRVSTRTKVENRRDDLYSEVVADAETGEIIHECREPLSQHRGHGDARKPVQAPRKTLVTTELSGTDGTQERDGSESR
jgi:predicted RNA-binding Zn-ribbon protein involved in translation (DUF1610 family)